MQIHDNFTRRVLFMSLRRRKVLGELTRGKLIKNAIIGGILVGILLGAWFGYPAVLDAIFGSRGDYDFHEDLPEGDPETYENVTLPFAINIVVDP